MTKKVYSIDLLICATAYIKADSVEEATQMLMDMDRGLEMDSGQYLTDSLKVSAAAVADPRLPTFSLGPAMTAYPGVYLTMEQAGKSFNKSDPPKPEHFICVYDPAEDA